jgi:gliding motility-associated-like protein
VQHNTDDLARLAESAHGSTTLAQNTPVFKKDAAVIPATSLSNTGRAGILRSHAYNVDFVGANENAVIVPDKIQPGYNNYFIGNDSTKWSGGCRLFQSVMYREIYPGIDVKFYSEYGNLKYEFIVHPGADPSKIVMKFDGVDNLAIRSSELIIKTSVGEVRELYPYTYQYEGSQKVKLDCRYQLNGNSVKFAIKKFSQQSTLVIDPILIFASFTGSTADNWGYTATYGNDGTFFAGGIVFDTGFPVSTGAFQTKYNSSSSVDDRFWNMGIMKFSANGTQRLYATYIGGDSQDQPHSLFCDPLGNLVIAGRTASSNYPITGAFGPLGGWDIVVTKLNAAGTALIGSVRIGGKNNDGFNTADSHAQAAPQFLIDNYGDDSRSEVILDGSNNIYVASCTMSPDFYTTPNAVQKTLGGVQDAVLLKLDPNCKSVLYSTYLGGKGYDAGFVLSINPLNQDVYMAGGTTSSDFPGNKAGSYQPVFNGGKSDGFIAVFSSDGSVLRQATYVGTTGMDIIYGIQFDKNGFPYIMGVTSGNWPVVSVGNTFYSNPDSKQFICKIKKDLSGFVYSTVFGTGSPNPNISPVAFLVDRCENVYVSGWGRDIYGRDFISPITGMPITSDAIKKVSDGFDFYFIVLQRDASKLLYATFYGQDGGAGEHVDGGTSRFDQNGIIYQAICANCIGSESQKPQWPVTPGAWCCSTGRAAARAGGQCNLAALKIKFDFSGVHAGVRAYINSVFDTTGCVPLAVTFRDTLLNAKSYEWNFGDGSPVVSTDSFEITHVYNNIGSYNVQLVAVDSSTCNIRDTAYTTIIVRNDIAVLDFNPVKLPPCESLIFRFDNLSTTPANKPFTGQKFVWDFGDGTRLASGQGSVNHTYAAVGTYKVRLVLLDTSYCNGPDSVVKEIRLSPVVKAQFEVPVTTCTPFNAIFKNTSLAGQTFAWDFGDGSTSNIANPTHLYINAGSYPVKLIVTDPNTCNVQDSVQTTIVVQSGPTAAFQIAPTVPTENIPYVFSNNSSANATRFKWTFGDGDSLLTNSRSAIEHQYTTTGTFNACLFAYNQLACSDTTCTALKTIVVPRLDVPNAFTPLGANNANRVYVMGFAIARIKFTIYNRLGQKIFETTDIKQGWDGRFNGVIQPMDVYAYTLEATFTDGTKASKKGDITLLR